MSGQRSLLQRLLPGSGPAEEPLLVALRAAGADFRRVVYTRNRRVMVSVGEGGTTVRLNERFRDAAPEVWRAVGRMYASGASPAERARSRALVQRFLRESPPADVPARRPPRRRVAPSDRPHVERLQAEFDRVNAEHFGGALPRVPIFLSGRMRRRNGHFSPEPAEIVLSRALCEDAVAGEAEQTLRHEMIHLWQHARGERPDHGPAFRRLARRLGVHPRATRPVRWKEPRPCAGK